MRRNVKVNANQSCAPFRLVFAKKVVRRDTWASGARHSVQVRVFTQAALEKMEVAFMVAIKAGGVTNVIACAHTIAKMQHAAKLTEFV